LLCVSGVTGSNLKRRLETIMTNRDTHQLDLGRKMLLAIAGVLAVAGPLAIGGLNAPPKQAQTATAGASEFEVASTKQFERPPEPGAPDTSFVGESGKPIQIVGNRIALGRLSDFRCCRQDAF
jgi:hypothetical protein